MTRLAGPPIGEEREVKILVIDHSRTRVVLGYHPGAQTDLAEALDVARGTSPAPLGDDGAAWPAAPALRPRRRMRFVGRTLARVDVWILITAIAGVIIAYLTLVKPQ